MSGLFAGSSLERPVTCEVCHQSLDDCTCPRNADGNVCRPKDQIARLRLERRRGKSVTVIADLDPVATDLKGLAKILRSTCGSGGSVTDAGIEIQGDHRTTCGELLRGRGFTVRG